MKFLQADWKHLLIANYEVEPSVLWPHVPAGTRIDDFDGRIFISLVAFLFDDTRVLGLPIPLHRQFPEVNLRFYVSPEDDTSVRAVTFIKEIVPKWLIPFVANTFFGENYIALRMEHSNAATEHSYSWKNGKLNRFSGRIRSELFIPVSGSVAEFITEHYWGYSNGAVGTLKYRVEHPQWRCCDVHDFEIDVDFGKTYGAKFAILNDVAPHSVMYAKGSKVAVSFPMRG